MWLLTWVMLIALPLYSLSASIVGLLGPVHFHEQAAVGKTALADAGPMAGWQDFRRVDHVGGASVHTHSAFDRHHHDTHDASAVTAGPDEGDAGLGDGAASNAPTLVFVAVQTALWVPSEWFVLTPWPARAMCRVESCDARRLDRPPKA